MNKKLPENKDQANICASKSAMTIRVQKIGFIIETL
jgi:hypothetical protein